jgi:hypothetical protein
MFVPFLLAIVLATLLIFTASDFLWYLQTFHVLRLIENFKYLILRNYKYDGIVTCNECSLHDFSPENMKFTEFKLNIHTLSFDGLLQIINYNQVKDTGSVEPVVA